MLIAILASPLLIAATLASLRDASRAPRDLGAAAATLYWPFLRVIVVGRGLALAAARADRDGRCAWRSRHCATQLGAGISLGARNSGRHGAALVAVFLLAAVDYALVRLEAGRSRAALRAWLAGLRFALARPALTLGVWAGAGVCSLSRRRLRRPA